MKKTYLRPETDHVVCVNEGSLMVHSDNHVGAKDLDFGNDNSEGDESNLEIKNLWDD